MAAPHTTLLDFSAQGLPQLIALGSALLLCTLIGLERELRRKSAGLRTHTLVGLGAALFMLVGKFGFGDVIAEGTVMLDPSRVAAQIASGVGFIGAGLIFVRRDDHVSGLTTAATVWLSAAVGTACGAGLWVLGSAVTAAYFLVAFSYPWMIGRIARREAAGTRLLVTYRDGPGSLRAVLGSAAGHGFEVTGVRTRRRDDDRAEHPAVDLALSLRGGGSLAELAAVLADTAGVLGVRFGDDDDEDPGAPFGADGD